MNSRERILAFGTAALVIIYVLNMGLGKFRASLNASNEQIAKLTGQISDKKDKIFEGSVARKQLGELRERSLPSDPEKASPLYQEWLTNWISRSGLSGIAVEKQQDTGVNTTQGKPLYRRYAFKCSGSGSLPQITRLFEDFYQQPILHRIEKVVLNPQPNRDGVYSVTLDVQAVAMSDAPKDRGLPTYDRTAEVALSDAGTKFLQRNLFSPPNKAPKFAGEANPRAVIGQPFEYVIRFDDPERQSVDIELVGEAPEGLRLNRGRIEWSPQQLGRYELAVRATDAGWPAQTIDQKLTIQVENPPAAPEIPKFDESRTAVLTGLVKNGENWQAWINLRTQSRTLKVGVGDAVKIGAIDGQVKEITESQAIIQSQDRQLVIKPGQSLAEAKPISVP